MTRARPGSSIAAWKSLPLKERIARLEAEAVAKRGDAPARPVEVVEEVIELSPVEEVIEPAVEEVIEPPVDPCAMPGCADPATPQTPLCEQHNLDVGRAGYRLSIGGNITMRSGAGRTLATIPLDVLRGRKGSNVALMLKWRTDRDARADLSQVRGDDPVDDLVAMAEALEKRAAELRARARRRQVEAALDALPDQPVEMLPIEVWAALDSETRQIVEARLRRVLAEVRAGLGEVNR